MFPIRAHQYFDLVTNVQILVTPIRIRRDRTVGSGPLVRRLAIAIAALVIALGSSYFAVFGATAGWPTYQHDPQRSGADPDTPQIASISPNWTTQLDGQLYAQPLVSGNTVYAATENNTVYALNPANGSVIWQQHLSTPASLSQLPCGNINPYGITGTPVVDQSSGVLYAVALQSSPTVHHELYALNVNAGGAVLHHFPIDAPGSDPTIQGQRGALALASGEVYVTYSGRAGDCGSYVGRVVGASTSDTTGSSVISYALPNTSRGGIWAAPSVDGSGNVYVATGNSNATGSTPDRGESVVRLSAQLGELDFFTAPEFANLNSTDTDIGSIGPILLQNGWILQSGKSGFGYLLNSAALGHLGGQMFEAEICDPNQEATGWGAYLAPSTVFIPCTSALKAVHIQTNGTPGFSVSTIRSGYGGAPGASPPILSGGVLWNLDTGNKLLLGFDPTTGATLFSQPLAGTPDHFAAPSAGAGNILVPAGSMLEAFAVSGGTPPSPTPTATATLVPPTPTATATSVPPTPTATATTAAATATPTSTAPAQATYSSHATVTPGAVAPGTSATITSSVTSSQALHALVDVEVYDPSWNKVFQQFWDNQSFAAGQTLTFTSTWPVAATAPLGKYTVMIGVFSPGWGTLYNWNGAAATFAVAQAPTATPTPTRTPTPLPTNTPTVNPNSARSFTTSASASPPSVTRGAGVSITTSVTSSSATKALVDVEIYDASWHKVFQQFWDNQSFAAGQTQTYQSAWTVPTTAATGTYTLMVGVFSPGWGSIYAWNSAAAHITVN
ncbi:MAG: PQQ-binding-like beta-propeller repeat protein [Chloroflexi bacterium]|nr:PQQ-binding-like beta-propeller repeat protein [Chloroflexota bacterium]